MNAVNLILNSFYLLHEKKFYFFPTKLLLIAMIIAVRICLQILILLKSYF